MVYMAQSSVRFEISELAVSKSGWTTLFVDQAYAAAHDDNDGYSWAKPKKTIAGALADAEPWCKIYVKSGEYAESITIPHEHVQLIGITEDGASAAKIVATGGTALIITAGFCAVENIAIEATNQHGIQATTPGHRFDRIAMDLTNTSGSAKYGIWLNDSDRSEICNCHIDGNGSDDMIGIIIGEDCVDVLIHDNYITGCGDGIGDAGCAAGGVCGNAGYCMGVAETAQRSHVYGNIMIDSCVGIYLYKHGGEDYKGHSIIHNQFYEICNYDVYDQYDPDDASDPSGIIIRENFYGYTGWFDDTDRDGRADYMVRCYSNYDRAPLSSPRAWETQAIPRANLP
ncbi:MAG: right-handed parallel beta-helix repeat-containing protein [Acholeplasmataceae bacterium]|jgi:hypothetical protein